MLIGPAAGQSNEDYFAQLQRDPRRSILAGFNRVKRCEVLVIDEISMLPGRQFEFVEFLFRRLRGRDEPFGGCQVIATGDFLQLPPVRKSETERYDWAFQSPAWAAAEFRTFVLDKVRRQDEPGFVRALADFRVGRVWGDTARILQSRVRSNPPATMTRLFTHNVQVDKWNSFQLSELPGDETVLHAEQSGPELQREFLTRNLLTPATLHLKPGALVMFTVNKNEPGRNEPLFVNGQIGTVEAVEPDAVLVRCKDGAEIRVERFTWRYDAQDDDSASFQPVPAAAGVGDDDSQGARADAGFGLSGHPRRPRAGTGLCRGVAGAVAGGTEFQGMVQGRPCVAGSHRILPRRKMNRTTRSTALERVSRPARGRCVSRAVRARHENAGGHLHATAIRGDADTGVSVRAGVGRIQHRGLSRANVRRTVRAGFRPG